MERTVVTADKVPPPVAPLSPAIKARDFLFVSGQVGADPATHQVAKGIEGQTRQCLENINPTFTRGWTAVNQHHTGRGCSVTIIPGRERVHTLGRNPERWVALLMLQLRRGAVANLQDPPVGRREHYGDHLVGAEAWAGDSPTTYGCWVQEPLRDGAPQGMGVHLALMALAGLRISRGPSRTITSSRGPEIREASASLLG